MQVHIIKGKKHTFLYQNPGSRDNTYSVKITMISEWTRGLDPIYNYVFKNRNQALLYAMLRRSL